MEGDKRGRRTAGALGSAGAGIGGAALATAATACCAGPAISPLIVVVLGASGAAWAAGLKPYAPYVLAASGLLVGYALWALRPSRDACRVDGVDPRGRSRLRVVARVFAGIASLAWLAAVALNVVLR